MRRPTDPNDPKDKARDKDESPPGGRARERLDLFNRQRGLPTDGTDTKKDDAKEAPETPPKTKRTED